MTDESIEEFKSVCLKAYGMSLTDAEARLHAGRLIELFRILMRPSASSDNQPVRESSL